MLSDFASGINVFRGEGPQNLTGQASGGDAPGSLSGPPDGSSPSAPPAGPPDGSPSGPPSDPLADDSGQPERVFPRESREKEASQAEPEGDNKTENPQDYLDKALERQGLDKAPNRMKESWTENGYKYEVRIHEANPEYGKQGSIYRVSRRKLGVDANGQGYGTEYLDSNGAWHHTSTLKPQNPSYNPDAAANTHIQVPQ